MTEKKERKRRMGSSTAEAYQALLDATETVLRDEGYGAVTSRRVCEIAGIKPQLLYYYFETMDELFLSAFKRRTERGYERLRQMLIELPPLEAVWTFVRSGIQPGLTFEYMALANHNAGVRAEVASFLETSRQMQLDALEGGPIIRSPDGQEISPNVALFMINSFAVMLEREASLGITAGHDEVERFMEKLTG